MELSRLQDVCPTTKPSKTYELEYNMRVELEYNQSTKWVLYVSGYGSQKARSMIVSLSAINNGGKNYRLIVKENIIYCMKLIVMYKPFRNDLNRLLKITKSLVFFTTFKVEDWVGRHKPHYLLNMCRSVALKLIKYISVYIMLAVCIWGCQLRQEES